MEGGDIFWLVVFITIIAHLPAIIMTIVGFAIKRQNPNGAKILFIISGIYLVVGLGICGLIFIR